MTPDQWMHDTRLAIDRRLDAGVADADFDATVASDPLRAAMRYSLLAPGKRIRPLLTVAVAEHFGASGVAALDVGCAFEMVHAASLIYDDLPCMDDETHRRGQIAAHRQFGEDTAILAAIALMNEAYGVIARAPGISAETRLGIIESLARTMGSDGLAAGQCQDLRMKSETVAAEQRREMHHLKTGVLFIAAAMAGAHIAGLDTGESAQVRGYAEAFGLVFQMLDDLDDGDGASSPQENQRLMTQFQQASDALTHARPDSPLAGFAADFQAFYAACTANASEGDHNPRRSRSA